MGLRSLLKRLKARFRPSRVEARAVPRLVVWEFEEGFDEQVADEVIGGMIHDLEESIEELNDAFRGSN